METSTEGLDTACAQGTWDDKYETPVFVGLSRNHNSTVPLALNLDSGHISPQYHTVFDDWFSTVSSTSDCDLDLESEEWIDVFGQTITEFNGIDL